VTPMAIYHHVGSKDGLLAEVMNHIILAGLENVDVAKKNWREELVAIVRTFRNAFVANPGAGRVFVRQAVVGPGTAIMTEHLFRLLHAGGLSGDAVAETADAITLVILGSLVNELTRPPQVRDRLLEHLPETVTPFMLEHMPAYSHRDPEERFLITLNWLLDGSFAGAPSRGHT
jgi:AcrR family transcriptional regulator